MLFSRPKRIGKLIRRGDDAQRRGDWRIAYHCYEEIVAARPDQVDIWVQLGHAAKELGHLNRAEQAYREALRRGGDRADTHNQLGHLFKLQGMRAEAIAAYANALRADPESFVGLEHLAFLGARDAIPDGVFETPRRERLLEEIGHKLAEYRQLLALHAEASNFAVRRYDSFRKAYPLRAPPGRSASTKVLVVIDAGSSTPADLRATLVSLLDQSFGHWESRIRIPPELWGHPVESFAFTDDRIVFISRDHAVEAAPDAWVLSLAAGVSLDPQCLAWFAFTIPLVDADAFHADHDHVVVEDALGMVRAHPCLYGAFDPYMLMQTSVPPPVVMMRAAMLPSTDEHLRISAGEMHRRALLAISDSGKIAHIPRVLSSLTRLTPTDTGSVPMVADTGSAWDGLSNPPLGRDSPMSINGPLELRPGAGSDPVVVAVPVDHDAQIRVVIPSRDAASMLQAAVDSLLRCSAHPERLRLTIVDNRSTDAEALALLQSYRHRGIEVLVMDEPFNWSRANNLVAAATREPHLVFVNNDTKMLTRGWDNLVAAFLERDDVGALGARLLYPDHTLQHGGTIFTDGSPRHEGVGAAEGVAGPLGRWTATRIVGAVTGAFVAVRRDRFEAVGGFDEKRLAIAFNDVDFCLRIRARGWRILYSGAIELIHHESKTRGHGDTQAKIAWDLAELRTLRERWGDALGYDPGYNPQWTEGPVPFDGLREPSFHRIIEHIKRSAERNPWRVDPPPAP